ncbi:50S ribosomal protein L31e [Thermogladius sp.]|uniref:50S ribosomal protein L31e n=1 Tax=Thermogladius sp. TaxID=2023064 RepID=UPI003D14FF7D
MSEAQVKRSVHVIPLSRVYFGRRMNRADRAVRLVRKYVARHYKQAEKIVIDPLVNKFIWSRGREKPPRRVVVEIRYDPEEKTAKVLLARSPRKTKTA